MSRHNLERISIKSGITKVILSKMSSDPSR